MNQSSDNLFKSFCSSEQTDEEEDEGVVVLTSLNSGFRVFFITAVLCLDVFSMSGFRYLTGEEEETHELNKPLHLRPEISMWLRRLGGLSTSQTVEGSTPVTRAV